MVQLVRHRPTKGVANRYAEPNAIAPHLYSTPFSEGLKRLQALRAFVQFWMWGRRDFVLRATKIVLTELAAIRGNNSQLRLSLARNCDECIFDFFNRIGRSRSSARRC